MSADAKRRGLGPVVDAACIVFNPVTYVSSPNAVYFLLAVAIFHLGVLFPLDEAKAAGGVTVHAAAVIMSIARTRS